MEPPRPLSALPQDVPRDIQAVAPIAGRDARRDREQRRKPASGVGATDPALPSTAPEGAASPVPEPDPGPDRLVQALDRLRATNELRPVELELARLALRLYRGVALPAPPPADTAGTPPADGSAAPDRR